MSTSVPNPPRTAPLGAFLVALPFALIGGFAIFMVVTNMRNGTLPWPMAPVMGSAAFVFLGLAALIVVWGTQGVRNRRISADLQAAFPGSPWMWREDWAQSRCESRVKASVASAWVIALLWNGVCTPLVYFGIAGMSLEAVRKNPIILMAFIFPLVGIGMLIWAVRVTLRRAEFGKTCFMLSPTPGVIGGRLRGNIHTTFPQGAASGVQLKLSCINHVETGSGNTRSVWDKIRWREEQSVPPERLMPGPDGTLIPVDFQIPDDALEYDNHNPYDAILWILEADADVPGINYRDSFELPVFRTKDSSTRVDRSQAFAEVPEGPAERPAGSKIIVQPSPAGGVMFKFPARRNPGAALGTSLFFLLWTGLVWFLWTHAHFLFTFFFAFFDLILLNIVLSLWTGSSAVTIEGGTVAVNGGLFGVGRRQVVPCSELAEIRIPIGMQTGGTTGTPYYNIQLVTRDGGKIIAAQALRDKQEAEWLVGEMKRAAGMRASAASAS